MRLQKEEKIVVILLLMALGSLSVAFWAFPSQESVATGTGLSVSSSSGKGGQQTGGQSTSVMGRITELKSTVSGGHILISLDSTSFPVFVPASSGAGELAQLLKRGERIAVTGIVRDYQGREEIEVLRSADVQRIN